MPHLGEKAFKRIGAVSGAMAKAGNPLFGGAVRRIARTQEEGNLDWAGDADWVLLQQEPLRARRMLRVAFLCVLLLLWWSAVAEIDEVTKGQAKVVPSSQLQVIQSFDGGVVEEIMVREGQIVEAGAILLQIDPTRFMSSLRESRASQLSLQAKALRLQALTQGLPFDPPDDLARDAPDVVAHERRLYESSRSELQAQISIAQEKLSQRQQELNEMRARYDQADRGLRLLGQELAATQPLVKTGAVSEVEVLRLERDVSRLRGDRAQAGAQISRVQASIQEALGRIEEVKLTTRNEMSAELSETMSTLAALSEGGRALQDKVKHADIRSPVRGTVKRLLVNTVGGVVLPGKDMIEIVPLDDTLILEAQVSPKDIAFLRPGQDAMVKFTAYDYAIYGGLEADVESIGADSVLDEQGNAFFLVRVRTRKPSLGEGLPVIPGMVAEVDVLTGKKTVLAYLLKPVLRAKANALSER